MNLALFSVLGAKFARTAFEHQPSRGAMNSSLDWPDYATEQHLSPAEESQKGEKKDAEGP